MSINTNLNFINSALTEYNYFGVTVSSCLNWLKKQQEKTNLKIVETKFSKLDNWYFDDITGNLKHTSGKFFSIEGINVTTNFGIKSTWNQPIINQPEIGFLGIITKKFNGTLHFLLQAKIEPGNINYVQLSPTLQATKSNYTQVHGGQTPPYLEFFNGSSKIKSIILSDQLQSEQGARFLRKRNRNIIIEIEEEVDLLENFIWLTLGQIKSLLKYDNVLNMDTRTVISSINFDLNKSDLDFSNN
jgi:oxidase EvaA